MIKTSRMLDALLIDVVKGLNENANEMLCDSTIAVHAIRGIDDEASMYLNEYIASGIEFALSHADKDIYQTQHDDFWMWIAGTEEECGKFLLELRAAGKYGESKNGNDQSES